MASRTRLRERLRHAFGERCYWCARPMRFPTPGVPMPDWRTDPKGATVEHHVQKQKGTELEMHLRLAHRRCNR